ncbi:hypothetical protein AUR04nite_00040 [Glutamicibacter uratoxydans]|uniref:Lipoprotein n=1 Tax=Glutamicibacter uratoxydans TaxID=43667 RepID=A0A4Y4DGW8_GLUUR|nr:hypothetical protein [Glutamicibacter uratoxydans]GED04472.1 hypothetical protein AUR04nite_00040 [Glutamicibacter uratoxydans]
MKTKPALKYAALATAGAFLLSGCSVVSSWVGEGKKVVSAPHVTEQYEVVIDHYNSMIAAANNACNAITTAKNDRSSTIVEDPAMAYKATFRKIQAEYGNALDNVFKAGLVGPQGYPSADAVRNLDTRDFCLVGEDLIHMRGGN